MTPETEPARIVLFDGVCNLCEGAVLFILARDPAKRFQFASLQSQTGQQLMIEHGMDAGQLDSFILIEDGKAYSESTAALKVARRLSGGWPLFYALIVLPKPLRDLGYKYIARNRYRWFGKKESCLMPTPELRARFLE